VIFIIFLLTFGVWLRVSGMLGQKAKSDAINNRTFWNAQLSNLLSTAALFVFVFILTGYFNWELVAAYFVASEICLMLAAVLSGLLGSPTSQWGVCSYWAGFEFGRENARALQGLFMFAALLALAYPVAVGISYFRLPPTELPLRIFQYTLLVTWLPSFWVSLVVIGGVLASENPGEETRTRCFTDHLSNQLLNALRGAILLWSVGLFGAGQRLRLGSVSQEFSPVVLGLLKDLRTSIVKLPAQFTQRSAAKGLRKTWIFPLWRTEWKVWRSSQQRFRAQRTGIWTRLPVTN
jgi:hypothetical protein